MQIFKNKTITDFIWIILIAILVYWPVSFMVFSVKNDAINYFLALRYNTSESIQNGIFPLWSPYINLGYPVHGDMQSGVWNPIVLILSLFRKYDIYWLQFETILTIIIAGIGMYRLLQYLKLERKIVLGISIAYMLCGYITDAGQFLNWLYASSFLPFLLLYSLKSFTSFKRKDAFYLGVAYSLMLLCAYPADFIIVTYFISALVIVLYIKSAKATTYKSTLSNYWKQLCIAGISFVVLCLPAILSYIPFLHSINRGAGVDIETALSNSLSPINLISFITPWPTQRATIFQLTDPLIRNCYIGIIPLVYFINFLVNKKSKTTFQKFLLISFVFFLLFSLGRLGGVRVITYYILPFFNSFRHPANAKLFFIFIALILAGYSLNDFFKNEAIEKHRVSVIFNVITIIVGVSFIISLFNNHLFAIVKVISKTNGISKSQYLKTALDSLSFYDFLLLNSFFLLLFLMPMRKIVTGKKLLIYLPFIVLIDMGIVTQLMMPLTYVRLSSPKEVQRVLDKLPNGYPVPDNKMSIKDFSKNGMDYFNLIGCLNPFNKLPGRSDYIITPSNLSTQEFFWNYETFREKVILYPLVYFADTIYKTKDISSFIQDSAHTNPVLADNTEGKTIHFKNQNNSFKILSFLPGSIIIEAKTSTESFLIFMQNYYPNWHVSINGSKAQVVKSNLTFMGVAVPAGTNLIYFNYQGNQYKYLGVVSFLFLVFALLYFNRKNE